MKTVLINGSPKKKGSVSGFILGMIRLLLKGDVVTEKVRSAADHQRVLDSIKDADTVVFGLPLYVDGVPSHMLVFMKEMEKFCADQGIRLNVYVASNGGFIEGCQNKPLMRVFENFCSRCGFRWCGGVGIGGGVMLNVMRILVFVYAGIFVINAFAAGLSGALSIFAGQMGWVLFFSAAVLFYCLRMGIAISKGESCGVKYTRILLPSFVFILVADIFFVILSVFQGGIFRGWLRRK